MTSKKDPPDWTQIRLAYIHSTKTLRQIAAEFRVTDSAAEKRAEREGWTRLRRAASESVSAAAHVQIETERATELASFNAADLRVAKAVRSQVAKMINAAAQPGAAQLSPTELRNLASAAEAAQRVGRLALGSTTANTGLSSPDGGPIPIASVALSPKERAQLVARALAEF